MEKEKKKKKTKKITKKNTLTTKPQYKNNKKDIDCLLF